MCQIYNNLQHYYIKLTFKPRFLTITIDYSQQLDCMFKDFLSLIHIKHKIKSILKTGTSIHI